MPVASKDPIFAMQFVQGCIGHARKLLNTPGSQVNFEIRLAILAVQHRPIGLTTPLGLDRVGEDETQELLELTYPFSRHGIWQDLDKEFTQGRRQFRPVAYPTAMPTCGTDLLILDISVNHVPSTTQFPCYPRPVELTAV